jgi:predicted nucleic acid-binding protein
LSGFVADASAAAAWVLPDEKNPAADLVFDRAMREGFVVPFIWPAEIANLLMMAERRGRIDTAKRREAASILAGAAAEIDGAEQSTLCSAAALVASQHGLSIYDALYLELAARRGLPLATSDARLAKAARDEGVPLL